MSKVTSVDFLAIIVEYVLQVMKRPVDTDARFVIQPLSTSPCTVS